MTTPRHPGRAGAKWNRARAQIMAGATICHLCGRPLDFDAPPRSRWAPSADHVLPLKTLRSLPAHVQKKLATDPKLLRPAHVGCNARRGARSAPPERTSRKW